MAPSRRALFRQAAVVSAAAALATVVGDTGGTAEARASMRPIASAAPCRPGRPLVSARIYWGAGTSEPAMALTFDDGPLDPFTRPLLDLLDEERVVGTFSVVGRRVLAQRDLVRREVSRRHELVNHTWSHVDLSIASEQVLAREIDRTDELLAELCGAAPRFLRPPFGRLSGSALRTIAERNHDVLLWDTQVNEHGRTPAETAADVLAHLHPGLVLLAHDAAPPQRHRIGLAAMHEIIRGARARGYRFLTVSELHDLA